MGSSSGGRMWAGRPAECKVAPKLLAVCMADVLLTHVNRIKTSNSKALAVSVHSANSHVSTRLCRAIILGLLPL